MTTNLIINDELKNLLPPLSIEELEGLEASILKDGCLSPLITWSGILVDGHHRYGICVKHDIPFSTTEMDFADLADAKVTVYFEEKNHRTY